ncbi:MAG: hypothetical protein ACKVVT_03390 [Dehalococcoidia bacterium]
MPTHVVSGLIPSSATPGQPARLFQTTTPGTLISLAISGGDTSHYFLIDVDKGLATARQLPGPLPAAPLALPPRAPFLVTSQGRLEHQSLPVDLDYANLEISAWSQGKALSRLAVYWICWRE